MLELDALFAPEIDSLLPMRLTAGLSIDNNPIRAPAPWIEKKRDN